MDDPLGLTSLRAEIARVAPEFAGGPVVPLGEGMDSRAVLAGADMVFRFAKHDDAADGLRREIALLPRLAPTLPLAVPRFECVAEHAGTGRPFVGYRLIRGEPLRRPLFDGLAGPVRDSAVDDLGAFLDALHAFPVGVAAACGVRPHGTRDQYDEDLRLARQAIWPLLGAEARRDIDARLQAHLDDDANFAARVLLHGDVWPEHVLFSPESGRIAGVIDLADVSIGDPDYDLAFLAMRLGPGFLASWLARRPCEDPARLAAKLRAIAMFNAVEDVSVGLERADRALVEAGIADLLHLRAGASA